MPEGTPPPHFEVDRRLWMGDINLEEQTAKNTIARWISMHSLLRFKSRQFIKIQSHWAIELTMQIYRFSLQST